MGDRILEARCVGREPRCARHAGRTAEAQRSIVGSREVAVPERHVQAQEAFGETRNVVEDEGVRSAGIVEVALQGREDTEIHQGGLPSAVLRTRHWPANVSMTLSAAGPRMTMNSTGKMNRSSGKSTATGSFMAFSSAR